MSNEHTPGPWAVGPDLEIFYSPNGSPITRPLRLTSMDGRTEEDRANARLIAAAPEMLYALEEIIAAEHRMPDYHPNWMGYLRAVVAMAKGESE